jgi:hypothetical protein
MKRVLVVATTQLIQQLRQTIVHARYPPRFLHAAAFAWASGGRQSVHTAIEIREVKVELLQEIADSRSLPVGAMSRPFDVDLRTNAGRMGCCDFE